MNRIQEALGNTDAQIIMGQIYDDQAGEDLSLTIIATGLARPESIQLSDASSKKSTKQLSSSVHPLQTEIAIDLPLSSNSSSHTPPSFNLQERMKQINQEVDAIERARHTPAYSRYGIAAPPPSLSSARIEPSKDDSFPPFRRHNPRLYDNAD